MNGTWSYLLASEHHPQYVSLAPLHSSHVVYWLQFWTTIFTNCEIKIRNFEWHLEITKMNGHPKKSSQTVLQHSYIYVCVNWEIFLWSDRKFCLPWVLGGRGVPRSISGLPPPNISSKSAHDKLVYNLASHIQTHYILRMLPGYSINYLKLYIISVQ